MLANDLMLDSFERVRQDVHSAVEGLDDSQLAWRPSEKTNSIAWLVWHLTRVMDDHISELAGKNQLWKVWRDKFDFDVGDDTGYGHNDEQVAKVKARAEQLLNYYDAVNEKAIEFIKGLAEKDYTRVVDRNWNPPVTLAVRLVSVINDCTQHTGQAAYVRGLLR